MVTEKHAKESNPTEPNLTQGANLTLIQFFGQPSFFWGGGGLKNFQSYNYEQLSVAQCILFVKNST